MKYLSFFLFMGIFLMWNEHIVYSCIYAWLFVFSLAIDLLLEPIVKGIKWD